MNETPAPAETVSAETFRHVIRELLFPLFPGATFESNELATLPQKNRRKLVTQVGSGTDLKLMPHDASEVCVQIHRGQVFTHEEKSVIGTFLRLIGRAYRDWETPYRRDTAASAMSEVVAGIISPEAGPLVGRLISMLVSWSQQTYEGNRIAFSLGVETGVHGSDIAFDDIAKEDFLKVLSNGQDTLIVVNAAGQLVRHESLTMPESSGDLRSPIRFEGVAKWTSGDERRAVVTLNRNGELLAFSGGEIRFARRRGDWRYFAHKSVIASFSNNAMAKGSSAALRREIYLTALDAAFARGGACIGVMRASQAAADRDALIDVSDQLQHADACAKARALSSLVAGRKFQDLDRRLRLELVSVDGATVLDHNGRVIAVGAILRIAGGSIGGGGREAASRELAMHGLGIKVSNDGYIRARNQSGDVIVEMA